MRVVLPVVPSCSQPSSFHSPAWMSPARAAQAGDFHSGSGATGGQMSLGSVPEKEMVANPSTAGPLLGEPWDRGHRESLNKACWIPSLAAAAGS